MEWNDTARDYPRDVCVHQLFAAQAARSPEAVAVVFEGDRLTYGELDARAISWPIACAPWAWVPRCWSASASSARPRW